MSHTIKTKLLNSPCKVCYFGGSVSAMKEGWRPIFHKWLCEFTKQEHVMIDSTLGSVGSVTSCFRTEEKVTRHKPDIVFIEFSINDRNRMICPTEYLEKSIEGIVKRIRIDCPEAYICFVYLFQKGDEIYARKGTQSWIVSLYEKISKHYSIPSIDTVSVFGLNSDPKITEYLKDSCHPTPEGNQLVAKIIRERFLELLDNEIVQFVPSPIHEDNWKDGSIHCINPIADIRGEYEYRIRDFRGDKIGYYAIEADSEINISFDGRAFAAHIIVGPDSGIIKYSIDKGEYIPKKIFDEWSTFHRNTYTLFDGNLEKGRHTISIKLIKVIPDRASVKKQPEKWPEKITFCIVDYMAMA